MINIKLTEEQFNFLNTLLGRTDLKGREVSLFNSIVQAMTLASQEYKINIQLQNENNNLEK